MNQKKVRARRLKEYGIAIHQELQEEGEMMVNRNEKRSKSSSKDLSHTETFVSPSTLTLGDSIPHQIKCIKLHLDATVNMILDCKQLKIFYNC